MLKNEVRIIGGKWRGRKIKFLDIAGLRPTPNRVRETLFNWLSPIICGKRCLDLFAGSGALGFEALSRGAEEVVFVDQNKQAIQQLKANQQLLDCEHADIYEKSAQEYLEQAIESFDIVFLDPPFHQEVISQICKTLSQKNLLADDALIYIEVRAPTGKTSTQSSFDLPENWQMIKQKRAGQVAYYLIQTGSI